VDHLQVGFYAITTPTDTRWRPFCLLLRRDSVGVEMKMAIKVPPEIDEWLKEKSGEKSFAFLGRGGVYYVTGEWCISQPLSHS
jgi:hypothetical protein